MFLSKPGLVIAGLGDKIAVISAYSSACSVYLKGYDARDHYTQILVGAGFIALVYKTCPTGILDGLGCLEPYLNQARSIDITQPHARSSGHRATLTAIQLHNETAVHFDCYDKCIKETMP